MMNVLLLALCLPATDSDSLFPDKPGVSWTFRETWGKKSNEFTLQSTLRGKEEVKIFSRDAESLSSKLSATENVLFLKRDGKVRWVIRTTKEEVKFYQSAWGYMYLQEFSFKKDLKPGMKWEAKREYFSCGVGSFPITYTTSSETIKVAAGTFKAIRIDTGDRRVGKETLWFAPGVGLIKWRQGDRVQQLVKMESVSVFPSRPGVSWTYRQTWGKKTHEFTLESTSRGKEKVETFTPGPNTFSTKLSAGESYLLLRRDGKVRWAVRTTKEDVMYYQSAWGGMYLQEFSFKKDLKPGMKWQANREYFSCGVGSFPVTYTTSSETITVPAGTYKAIRVDIGSGRVGRESLWFASGVGLVKWKQGPRIQELVKMASK